MELILIGKVKDKGIWRDFVRVHQGLMHNLYKYPDVKDEFRLAFSVGPIHYRKLMDAFRAERDMETEFKIEVNL